MELWASPFSEDPSKLAPTLVDKLPASSMGGTVGGFGRLGTPTLLPPNNELGLGIWNLETGVSKTLQLPKDHDFKVLAGMTRTHLRIGAAKPNIGVSAYLIRWTTAPRKPPPTAPGKGLWERPARQSTPSPARAARGAEPLPQSRHCATAAAHCPGLGETAERSEASGGNPLPFALHAAYWHDRFGEPKSGGCVNLSVKDAQWLFSWTDPQLPDGWHSVRSGGDRGAGTWVRVR